MGELSEDELTLHEKMAKGLFNRTWALMDEDARSDAQTEEMVHAAHASRYHWTVLVQHGKGTELHAARGDWQVSRAHALAGLLPSAEHYGRVCLERCTRSDLGAFDTAFAHEAIARAAALAGDAALAREHLEAARAQVPEVEEKNRGWLQSNLDEVAQELGGG